MRRRFRVGSALACGDLRSRWGLIGRWGRTSGAIVDVSGVAHVLTCLFWAFLAPNQATMGANGRTVKDSPAKPSFYIHWQHV